MANIPNRLQFVHHDECFNTVEEAKEYVVKQLDKINRPALYAEPMILKYKNEQDETTPNILLAIGSVGDGVTPNVMNRTFFIDCASIESSIEAIEKELEENAAQIKVLEDLIKTIIEACGLNEDGTYTAPEDDILKIATSLKQADILLSEYIQDLEKRYALYTNDTNSVELTLNKDTTGQTLSADVKVADYKTVNHIQIPNIILKEESGLYANVNLEYDEDKNDLIFSVNGEKKVFDLPTETYLVKGKYDIKTESLILTLNTGAKISINLEELIEEWTVLGEHSSTPIVLTKDHSSYEEQTHAKTWQDVLHADVRIATEEAKPFNILKKTDDGRSLYVDGVAKNIKYLKDGEYITVQEAIDTVKCAISPSNGNIVYRRQDGIYANVDLSYNAATNVLTFKHTTVDGKTEISEYTLNSAKLLNDVSYDSKREVIILRFTTADGKINMVEIPVADVITEWDVMNSPESVVFLSKTRNINGEDKLSADVIFSTSEYNIVERSGHGIYVRGTADNIRFDEDYTVEGKIKDISKNLSNSITEETNRAKDAESKLNDKIEATNTALGEEKVRAEKEETRIAEDLADETIRATNAEAQLERGIEDNSTAIEQETKRAKTDENIISGIAETNKANIAIETNRAKTAEFELDRKLDTEIARAKVDEQIISGAIKSEISTARENENKLESSINQLSTSINAEKERAVTRENSLSDYIKTVDASVLAEKNRALSEETRLNSAITAETHDRETEITRVEKLIADNGSNIEKTKEELLEEISENTQAISKEEARAKAVEAEISGNTLTNKSAIDKEIQDARSAERDLLDSIKSVSGDLKSDIDDINVTYDAASNKLTVITPNGTKDYVLTQASLIDHIEYISESKTLRIYYKVTGESGTKYVDIVVTDLFNQLSLDKAKSEAGAVHMELIVDNSVGNDILSAEVKISTKSTNALMNDNGSLYVSNEATSIVLPDGTNIYTALEKTNQSIETESQNRIIADNEVTKLINDEKNRAEKEEHLLSDSIVNEKNARLKSDELLEKAILDETNRAKGVEENLSITTLNNEGRLSALESKVNNEVSEREKLEINLTSDIHEVASDLEYETNQRKKGDNDLSARIDTLEVTSTDLNRTLINEIADRKAGDVDSQRLIDTEKLRATTIEGQLSSSVSDLRNALSTTNDKVNVLTASANTINSNLIVEITDRISGDTINKELITKEKERAIAAENALQASIVEGNTTSKELITKEKERAVAAENALQASIVSTSTDIRELLSQEIERAKSSEKDLEQTFINDSGKVSEKEGNIIVRYDDGIYAKASKLTYDTGSNTLTFTDANGKTSPIVLNSIDTIKDIYFDKTSDSLVFVYTVEGNEKTVAIPAASFFNGIVGTSDGNVTITTAYTSTQGNSSTGITANLDVIDIISTTNSTVNLVKTSGNKISASVNVATNVPNNILEIDGSDSSLFVNGEASNITATYKDKKTDVQTIISEISGDIIDLTNEVNYISGSVHDSLIILDRHTKEITELSGYVHTEVEKIYERIEKLEERLEEGFEEIYKEIERLNKKTTIIDDDANDYIKHTFTLNNDTTSPYYGHTMIHTDLSEDLSRDSDNGVTHNF